MRDVPLYKSHAPARVVHLRWLLRRGGLKEGLQPGVQQVAVCATWHCRGALAWRRQHHAAPA